MIGKRGLLVAFVIATVGLAACVVRTRPAHRHGQPAYVESGKHKPQKHKKHKKHRGNGHGDDD